MKKTAADALLLKEYDNVLDHRPDGMMDAITRASALNRAPMGHELYEVLVRNSN